MIRLASPLAILVALSGCVPEAAPTTGASCLAEGGREVRGKGGPICLRPTTDAGKACATAAGCETYCLADTRTCAAETPRLGCFSYLDAGGQKVALCVD
ncbi:MAG: hypothetical protein R3E44_15330 [Paracoccaceae bacterium]